MATSTIKRPPQIRQPNGSSSYLNIADSPNIIVGTYVVSSGISSGTFNVNWTALGGTASKKTAVLVTAANMPNGVPVSLTYVYDNSTATKAQFYANGIGSATGGLRFSYMFIDDYHA